MSMQATSLKLSDLFEFNAQQIWSVQHDTLRRGIEFDERPFEVLYDGSEEHGLFEQ
jgi:hypothetical protein